MFRDHLDLLALLERMVQMVSRDPSDLLDPVDAQEILVLLYVKFQNIK